MRRVLNGWRRAFIVLAVLYGAYAYVEYVVKRDNDWYAAWGPRLWAAQDSLAKETATLRGEYFAAPLRQSVATWESSRVSNHQASQILFAFAWLVPLALLYALGEAAAWVVRGFRKPKNILHAEIVEEDV